MTTSLEVAPKVTEIHSGVQAPESVAEGLGDLLADTYRLTFKTHAYHWNVEGPMFFSVHNLTEGQYNDMFAAADELAERIRALGQLAPMSLDALIERSVIEPTKGTPSAGEMCETLASDHERVAHRFHALIELSEKAKDPVTEDMATARAAFHEKAAWMLRALSAK